MTLQKDMLAALEQNEKDLNNDKLYSNRNSDHDFGAVLGEFCENEDTRHLFRYPDGKEEFFSFDN